ncbi:MAG: hypothetical protein ACYC61_19540 [Isosphaeraceae bacterium]
MTQDAEGRPDQAGETVAGSTLKSRNPASMFRKVCTRVLFRFIRAIDYASIFAINALVYSFAMWVEFRLIDFLSYLITDDTKKYPIVERAFHWFRSFLALFTLIVWAAHSLRSAWKQWRRYPELEEEIARGV